MRRVKPIFHKVAPESGLLVDAKVTPSLPNSAIMATKDIAIALLHKEEL
jgi:hypothetical protein